MRFVQVFWETLCREWFDIDKHRIDKYLLLIRRIVFFTFQAMQQSGWDEQVTNEFMGIYQQYAVNPSEPKVPNSTRTHLADVYVDEMVRLAATLRSDAEDAKEEIEKIPVAKLLEPFMLFIGTTTIKQLAPKIQESVFENTVVRIAEAEEQANQKESAAMSDEEGSDVEMEDSESVTKGNQIENENLEMVQFLIDQIQAVKQRMLAIAGKEEILPVGRKRLYGLYQTLCDTFPDEENDVPLMDNIEIKEQLGPEARKAEQKHKRKRENKLRERDERARKAKEEARNMVNMSSVLFESNALENLATVEEERGFEADIAKIREMDQKAGVDKMGEDEKSKSKNKKAQRAEKRKIKKEQQQQDEIPELIPMNVADTVSNHNEVNGDDGGAWVVCDKSSTLLDGKRLQQYTKQQRALSNGDDHLPSLFAEAEQNTIVRDRLPPSDTAAGSGESTPSENGNAAKRTKREKKKLTWALERNSVKRFLKKVPMLPSPEPLTPPPEPSNLKSVLRKESAYKDTWSSKKPMPPALKPVVMKPGNIKRERRVNVNGHASTPVRANRRKR